MFMWSIPPEFEPADVCGGWGRPLVRIRVRPPRSLCFQEDPLTPQEPEQNPTILWTATRENIAMKRWRR